MKLRDYRKNTYHVCKAWQFNPRNIRRTDELCRCLDRWVQSDRTAAIYDYDKCNPPMIVGYCSDRMNAGRAKGILRLLASKLDLVFIYQP